MQRWILLLLLATACSARGEAAGVPAAPTADEAAAVLKTHCAPCHLGAGAPGSVAKARAVFDLSRATWFDTIGEPRHAKVSQRLAGKASTVERDTVARFLETTRAR